MSSVSTTSSTPSATSATPASSSTDTDTSPGGTSLLSSQASLYLYTFLVTLILLLTVSGAIVVRSHVVRRQQRRLVAEAIRNGTYVPPERPAKKPLGAKPALHDAHLAGSGGGAGEGWDALLPLSVVLLSASDEEGAQAAPGTPPPPPLPPRARRPLRLLRLPTLLADRIRGPTILRPPAAASAPSAPIPSAAAPSKRPDASVDSAAVTPPTARVSVVIRMPAPPLVKSAHPKVPPQPLSIPTPGGVLSIMPPAPSDPSDELPYIEFGVAEVRMRGFEDADLAVGGKES